MPNRMEEMAAKGMGAIKEVKATLKGLSGVFKTLCEQHGEASALLGRASMTSDGPKRAELWQKIRAELLSHERGEIEAVYPVLRNYPETRALAEEHDREASELERLIRKLDGMDPSSPAWTATFDDLKKTVQQHVSEEEGEIFPKAQDVLGHDTAVQMESSFLAAKKRASDYPS